MEADLPPTLIDLAQEPAFSLGDLEVRPATLEVLAGARREPLEPRIMQVLVALARRRGEVVSRDVLVASCWGGRVVGDDAINRCISRLRKLAVSTGAFTIETVPRVGFRLAVAESRAPTRGVRTRRLWAWVACGVGAVLVATAGLWIVGTSRVGAGAEPQMIVEPFRAESGDASAVAAGLTEFLRGSISDNVPGLTLDPEAVGQAHRPALALGGAVSRIGDSWRARINLTDVPSGVILWSKEFRTAEGVDALHSEVGAAVVEVIYSAMAPLEEKGLKLDPRTLATFIRGSELISQFNPSRAADGRREFEDVVARAPQFAFGRGVLAYLLQADARSAPPPQAEALRRRAREEALESIRIAPNAAAYDALFYIERQDRPGDLAAAEDWLQRGVDKAPGFPVLIRECGLLTETGQGRRALPYCARAVAIRPAAAPVGYHQARGLAATGQLALAKAALDQAAAFHPEHFRTRLERLTLASYSGDPDEALTLLHNPQTAPQTLTPEAIAAFDAFLRARKSHAPADAERAIDALRKLARQSASYGPSLVQAAAVLGRLDEAFAAADLYPSPPGSGFFGYLFDPSSEAMRRDPRFWKLASRDGLVRYWRTRGLLPDFCTEPDLPYDCRTEMAKYG